MMQSWKKFRRRLAAFGTARDGNVAIIFAIATLPVIGAVGAAVDYSRANAVKAEMQTALDSAALMLSKEAPTDTPDQLQTSAQKYFNALFTRKQNSAVTSITASYSTTGGSSILVNASVSVPTEFMGIFSPIFGSNFNSITISGSSTAAWGMTRLRVALVLDNTGSMNETGTSKISKMDALKTATNNLLTQLKNAATTNGDVYVSIVPFVKDVNLDGANYNANWIDWTNWEKAPSSPNTNVGPGSSCPYSKRGNGYTCLTGPASGTTTQTIPSSGSYTGYICPSATYNGCFTSTTYSCTGATCTCTGHNNCSCSGSGSSKTCKQPAGYYEHAWLLNPHSTWNGCVVDRGDATAPNSSSYDTNVVAPTTNIGATLYSAEQYDSCPQASMGLSYDWPTMTTLVNNMSAAGNTNQAIGLQAGWMSLAGGGPFTVPPMDSNYTYSQIIILLTDGMNTQDRWYTDQTTIDNRQQMTCDNINKAGITLYTIQVNTSNDPTSTLLQHCAGSPGKYPDSKKFFLLTSPDQIVATFQAIGTNLTQLRVAK